MDASQRLQAAAHGALVRIVAEGAGTYVRAAALPRLLPVAPADLERDDAATARRLCLMLARALRRERNRGRAGHWTYDLSRHVGLLQAYRAERAALTRLQRAEADMKKGRGPKAAPR
jgi:hypothetical protein